MNSTHEEQNTDNMHTWDDSRIDMSDVRVWFSDVEDVHTASGSHDGHVIDGCVIINIMFGSRIGHIIKH